MNALAERLQRLTSTQRAALQQRLPHAASSKQLVAYVVPAPDASVSVAELRAHLSARLPIYMLPAHFMIVDALPKMPNGKVDRGGLPNPAPASAEPAADFIAPRTELEQRLAEIWMALLGTDMLDVRDNFFELGGHSLLVTQLAARLRKTLEVALPVSVFFESPTLEGLAARVAAAKLTAANGHADGDREEIEL
jgi:hypothetical protein